jgi:hypothetical protein
MAIGINYLRNARRLSSRAIASFGVRPGLLAAGAALAFAALPAGAQYPGQISTANKNAPDLRAVAVLEWTGDEAHPKASRLVPICVYDGQQLQDGGIYLARPQPLALDPETEYKLKQNGKTVGFFDIAGAAQEQGQWVGHGQWKALPAGPTPQQLAEVAKRKAAAWKDEDDADSDKPILHRRQGSGDSGNNQAQAPPPDPNRPTLHRTDTNDTNSGNSGDSNSGNSGGSGNAPSPDPDRPTLHRAPDSNTASNNPSSNSPDRPKLEKKNQADDDSYVTTLANIDPNRPRLMRGQVTNFDADVTPKLMGMPVDMNQEVAVSDARNSPDHPWSFSWANPDDETKMQTDLEETARKDLGLEPPPPPPAPKTQHTSSTHTKKAAPPPPPPPPLLVEQFRVFELEYGSGATMVLEAHTAGTGADEKFITLIAQPDLYGGLVILFKNITDAAHLDESPRMRLIDAVDALDDNRGELLFELRSPSQRQFALYRVLRGSATQIFSTTGSNGEGGLE